MNHSDPVIPPAAIEAAALAMHPCQQNDCRGAEHEVWLRSARFVLAAALPHLPARQIGDELAPELRQEIRTVMELGRALGKAEGRQEAAEEIAEALKQRRAEAIRTGQRGWPLLTEAWVIATRTADARTDPSGHTDLPPTPDAVSKRLPEETA